MYPGEFLCLYLSILWVDNCGAFGAVISTQPPGGLSAKQFRNQKAYRVPFVYPQIYSVYSDVLYSSIDVSTRDSRGLLFFHKYEVKKKMLSNNNLNWDFQSIYISHAVSYSRVCLSLWHRSNIGLSKLTLCAVSSPQKCTSAQSLDLWLSTFLESTPFDVANWPLFAPIYLS